MAAERYYYSVDGGEMEGPVDEAAFRQLCLDKVIGSGNFYCRESESEWRPLDPAVFLASLSAPQTAPAAERNPDSSGILIKIIGGFTVSVVILFAVIGWNQSGDVSNGVVPVAAASGADDGPEIFAGMENPSEDTAKFLRAERALGQIHAGTLGPSLQGRFLHALLAVTSELLKKVETGLKKESETQLAVQSAHRSADLDGQISKLRDLRDDQTDLVVYLQDFDQHFRDLMTEAGVPPIVHAQFIDVIHRKVRIDSSLVYWRLKLQLTNDAIVRLDFLRKNPDRWELKGGKIIFTDDGLRGTHEQMLNAIYADEARIVKYQQDLSS